MGAWRKIRAMPRRGTLVLKIAAASIESVRFIGEAIERAATEARLARLRANLAARRSAGWSAPVSGPYFNWP